MKTFSLAFVLVASSLSCFGADSKSVAPPPAPFGPVPTARQLKWHEMEQYAFVHFTVNTFTDKNGKGDIVREMADACKQEGLKFGVYVSPLRRERRLAAD